MGRTNPYRLCLFLARVVVVVRRTAAAVVARRLVGRHHRAAAGGRAIVVSKHLPRAVDDPPRQGELNDISCMDTLDEETLEKWGLSDVRAGIGKKKK